MKCWRIAGRCFAAPPPDDWPTRLTARLGQRPRRLGRWAELALYGALQCIDAAGEDRLPETALLSVSSVHGPDLALRAALAEARDDLPLPIGFLQSQPSQLLPTLARHLGWQGDGRCLSTRDPLLALQLALDEAGAVGTAGAAGASGALLGWVAESDAGSTIWLRLQPLIDATGATGTLQPAPFSALGADDAKVCALTADGQLLVGKST